MADRQDPTPAQRVLTGITTTGIPHLGNYVGALRPAIAASVAPGVESFLFLADYHGLIKCDDPARIAASRLEVATAWLAAGLDPERTHFYRQSDVPETLELQWLLTCVTSKGLMNRAHAYKAAVDANGPGEDPDAGISLGLFSYPVLMAADILLFNAHKVPVGRDQVQHIEMARDIAQRFNLLFGRGRELLVLPEAVVGEQPLLPGLDGRKMSKSYDNTVPLFSGGRKALEAAVARIVTDSRLPGEPKDPDSSSLLTLYAAFAPDDETAAFRAELEAGLGWGDAKQRLVRCIEREIAPKRERYDVLMAAPQQVEDILQAGAAKARRLAQPLMAELRDAVGLTRFAAVGGAAGHPAGPSGGKGKARPPALRQYRDAEGAMHFKLALKNGTVLVEGGPFDSGEAAGRCVQALREAGGDPSRLPAGVRRGAGVEDEALAAGLRAWIDATS